MFDKFWDSIKDNFSQKARNPILATIIIVWVFKNWRLVYGLFTFDKNTSQSNKLEYIETYFNLNNFYWNLGFCIFYAFVVLILTYFILGLSRFIVDFYENQVLLWIRKRTSETSVVGIEKFKAEEAKAESYEKRYTEERSARINAQEEHSAIEKRNAALIIKNEELQQLINNYIGLESQINQLKPYKDKAAEFEKTITSLNQQLNEAKIREAEEKNSIIKILEVTKVVENYLLVVKNILNYVPLDNIPTAYKNLELYEVLKLIVFKNNGPGLVANAYGITELGKEVYDVLKSKDFSKTLIP